MNDPIDVAEQFHRWTISQSRPRTADRWDAVAVATLIALLAALGALCALAFAPGAKADDQDAADYADLYGWAICETLDDHPTTTGVYGIGQAIVGQGLTPYDAGQAIALAVYSECPQHIRLITRVAARAGRA